MSTRHFLLHSLMLRINDLLCYNVCMILIVKNLDSMCHLINWEQNTLHILYNLISLHVLIITTIALNVFQNCAWKMIQFLDLHWNFSLLHNFKTHGNEHDHGLLWVANTSKYHLNFNKINIFWWISILHVIMINEP